MPAARRKHLESINISPIDLWDAVKDIDDRDLRHQTAIKLFLQTLIDETEAKHTTSPYKWAPQDLNTLQIEEEDPSSKLKNSSHSENLIKTLKKDRESYPGWLLCPQIYNGALSLK